MSLVTIQGNASGTGTLTIAAPNTNSSFTLTLPAATTIFVGTDATQTLTNKTLTTPNIDSAQIPTVSGTAPLYMCRAWVNFNGTGVVAIRASGNVTSITDNGTGDYTVTFTTAMTDGNYSVVAGANGRATDTTPDVGVAVGVGATTASGSVATGTRILVGNPSSAEDCACSC